MKKEIEQTPEEKAISRFLLMNKLQLLPEPTRFFEIGEEVVIGNLLDCKIVKPLYDRKAYLISYTKTDHSYGNPEYSYNELHVWSWLDIFRKNERKESFIKNADLNMNYRNSGVADTLLKLYHFGVDMNPTYQREYVWTQEDKVALINSIFNNIDIGKFVFIQGDFGNELLYEILDGKQRLNTLKEFYEDRLLYNGFKYSELSEKERSFFTNYSINVCEISDCDLKKKLRIFYHINISGKVMDKAHLEKVKGMIEEMESKK